MTLNVDTCYRALAARDPRFDGRFFVGVETTGIYCRPVCTARTPRKDRCTFYRSSAEAEKSGFRACFRCRPELAPGHAEVDAVQRVVEQAVAMIEEGFLDENGVDDLANAAGVTARHLRRAMVDAIGVTPVELAQTRRLALAKQLLQDTKMRITDVAFASGFSSVRRFNTAFRSRFDIAPSDVRRGSAAGDGIRLRLDYRPPLAWEPLLEFLRVRAIPGVERVDGDTYARVVANGTTTGTIRVAPARDRAALVVTIDGELANGLARIVSRLRTLFDLDAAPDAVARRLRSDRRLRRAVEAQPGLRVPGAFDPFETIIRTILGQQVSVRGATTLTGRLVETFGRTAMTNDPSLTHVFPEPARIARASADRIASIGLPRKRATTLRAVARGFANGALTPSPAQDVDEYVDKLIAIPGIGPWTAGYVAMRVLHHPDAFPTGDLVLEKTLDLEKKRLAERAETWRPWRAYAAMYVWSMAKGARS